MGLVSLKLFSETSSKTTVKKRSCHRHRGWQSKENHQNRKEQNLGKHKIAAREKYSGTHLIKANKIKTHTLGSELSGQVLILNFKRQTSKIIHKVNWL